MTGAQARTGPPVILATGHIDPAIPDALTRHGLPVTPLDTAWLAALPSGGASGPDAILWQDPQAQLAAALLEGADPAAACSGWLHDTEALLQALRHRPPGQPLLVEARLLLAGTPAELRARLCSRLGLQDLPPPVTPETSRTQAHPERSLAHHLAALVLSQITPVRDCLDALRSAGLAAPPARDMPLAALARDFAALTARLTLQQHAQATLEARLGAATHEADRALSRALAELRAEAGQRRDLERRLDRILTSTSWRLTRPLRRLGSLLGGSGSR